MKERMDLCRPCACAVEAEGEKLCRPLRRGIDQKVTCQRCGRRGYGMTYEREDSKSKAKE